MAKKRLPDSYTFDASAKTIVHASFSDITLAGIQVIVNVTDQIIIYNFADPNKGGTLATDTLTLDFDTTAMSDTDELMILVDDGLDQTVNLGSTDNAVLDAIAASVSSIDTDTTTIIGHVDGLEALIGTTNTTLTTIDGRVDGIETLITSTNTKLDTTIGHLDGVEGLLTTIDADTGNIATAVQLIDDTIFTAGTDTYTEATSKGQLLLAVRRDADTTLANTTNEFTPLQVDANGYLKVEVFSGATLPVSLTSTTITGTVAVTQSGTWDEVGINDSGNSITVDNGGTFAVQVDGAALTALQLIDNLVLLEDVAHQTGDPGIQMLAVRDDTLNIRSGTEGDYEPLHTDGDGALWAREVNSDEMNTSLNNIEASASVMDDWDNGASDGASVSGDVAHDTADAGEPVKIGMKAVALKANPTEVAAGDRTNWYADVSGVPFVLGGHPNVLTQGLQVTDADGAQTDAAIITAGANVAVVVTKVSVVADNANTTDVSVRIGFGAANTPAADAAQVLLYHPGLAPGSGVIEGNGAGIIGIGASNEDVRVTCEDPTGGSISIIVTYFTTDI